jgi:hypothetical protein
LIFYDDAERLISRFPAGSSDSEDSVVGTYLAESGGMSNADKIQRGLEVYNKGIKDYYCFRTMIEAMRQEGYDDKLKEYEEESMKLWPERYEDQEKTAA